MKVLVLWADDRSANLGVRALAAGTATVIRRAWGDDVAVEFQDLSPNRSGFRISIDLVKQDIGRRGGPLKEWLRQFDAVVDTGAGDSFTDIYGRNRMTRIMYTQFAASRVGIPVFLGPQTIGPFETWATRRAARSSLNRATGVFARDSTSERYARGLMRSAPAQSTDVVFALPPEERRQTRDVLLNVSGLLWLENPHVDPARYQHEVRELITTMLARGRGVSLLAHVIDNPTKDNDVPALEELQREFGDDVDVVVPDSLSGVRSAVASANIVLGSRMHACLNALSVGTPAVPMAYSRKFEPLLADLGWDQSVDLRSSASPARDAVELVQDLDGLGDAPVDQLLRRAHHDIDRLVEQLSHHRASVGPAR